MKKLQHVKAKAGNLFAALVILILLGCETTKQDKAHIVTQGYTQLDLTNPKDKEFYTALEDKLKNLGSLISVYADTEELNFYHEAKRSYPTNYRYTIKANPKISLEEIKHVNLSLLK